VSMSEPDGAVILLYHGVTDAASQGIENFSGKHMAAPEFDRQMAWLAEHAAPMTLRRMADALSAGEVLPPRSVAVTFDDSFRNKAEVALPILKRHGVPATFFITTGFIEAHRLFWTDKIEHCVARCPAAQLSIDLGEGPREFPLRSDTERIDAVVAIKSLAKGLPPGDRDGIVATLQDRSGVGEYAGDVANYQLLDWDGVRALDAGDAYDVGGHSVNHEILAYLDDDTLRAEISICLDRLQRELGHPVDLFSYPEGQEAHYDDRVIEVLKGHGVSICPSAIAGINQAGADPFHLRRIMVGFMGARFPYPDYIS